MSNPLLEGWQLVYMPDGWTSLIDELVFYANKQVGPEQQQKFLHFHAQLCAAPLTLENAPMANETPNPLLVNETLDQLAQRVALQMMDPNDGRVEWGAYLRQCIAEVLSQFPESFQGDGKDLSDACKLIPVVVNAETNLVALAAILTYRKQVRADAIQQLRDKIDG